MVGEEEGRKRQHKGPLETRPPVSGAGEAEPYPEPEPLPYP